MKILHEEILLGSTSLKRDGCARARLEEVRQAIRCVVWPTESDHFTIRPIVDGNGVLPIKVGFMRRLRELGWELEKRAVITPGLGPGKVDALKKTGDRSSFAAEWETGNISSSHRALNKICAGLIDGSLSGGVLVLPDRELYQYLTQRIGNFRELAPYFPVYRRLRITRGVLAVFAVAHDDTSATAPLIPKGTDGNALKKRALNR